jgi:glutamate dehydrogenase
MTSDSGKQKKSLLEQINKALKSRMTPRQARLESAYSEAYHRRVPVEEMARQNPSTHAHIISSQCEFFKFRQPGELLLRVFNPDPVQDGWESGHTIVEMDNDDMPFLVDTANLVFAEMDLDVHLITHPVVWIERDDKGRLIAVHDKKAGKGKPESVMQFQVNRQTNGAVLQQIEQGLRNAMQDVRKSVEDWQAMNALADDAIQKMPDWCGCTDPDVLQESGKLMEWLRDNHFIFLGAADYNVVRGKKQYELQRLEGSGLGIMREHENTVRSRPLTSLSAEARRNRQDPLIITKTNARSTIHRAGYLDYVGVLRFNEKGRVIGERRFIGLFTSSAYHRQTANTPLVRLTVQRVLAQSQLHPGTHAFKSLLHILETLPRDDLFQASVDELTELSIGVLNLQERRRVRLFIRRERFGRFYSCLVYIPRDHFNTPNRQKIQSILKRAFRGKRLDYVVNVSESSLARLQVIIRPKAGEQPRPDVQALEQKIVEAVRSWHDELTQILVQKHGEETGLKWAQDIGRAFPAAYVEDVSAWVAAFDVANAAALKDDDDLRMSLYRPKKSGSGLIRFKVFKYDDPIPLSDVLPMLENLGLRIVNERPYVLELPGGRTLWIQDFDMSTADGRDLNVEAVRERFQQAFENTWRGLTESDGFNRLILACRLHWREVKMIRAYCKYLLQSQITYSQTYMEATLASHPLLTLVLVELFHAMFDPARDDESGYRRELARKRLLKKFEHLSAIEHLNDSVLQEYLEDVAASRQKSREIQIKTLKNAFRRGLTMVASLDDDRILWAFYSVIKATLRTNYFQPDADGGSKDCMSFKLNSSRIEALPKPRPYREIWVFSPSVEGIHLRMGKVARGGLRWSDRREDFRTEVLGLMKAQNVKNTMIVPVGAKGGFVLKRPPPAGDRQAFLDEGIRCYKLFINGLLDITDNLDEDDLIHPDNVVRHDEDDPYLVVAADKGTATFSDTANAISREHGFWLDDAFASGGSVGYDHKAMGITAKGAWEGVKRHFRELGKNIQKEPFTVVGIGDMSGDVFGNGMLLSGQIRLQAAFNHLHIFLDVPERETASVPAQTFRMDRLQIRFDFPWRRCLLPPGQDHPDQSGGASMAGH